jgi:hypothetical protein
VFALADIVMAFIAIPNVIGLRDPKSGYWRKGNILPTTIDKQNIANS